MKAYDDQKPERRTNGSGSDTVFLARHRPNVLQKVVEVLALEPLLDGQSVGDVPRVHLPRLRLPLVEEVQVGAVQPHQRVSLVVLHHHLAGVRLQLGYLIWRWKTNKKQLAEPIFLKVAQHVRSTVKVVLRIYISI